MKKIILLLGLSMVFWSCEKAAKLEKDEYLIFGKINSGFSQNCCATLFKIEDGSLYADDLDKYISKEEVVFKNEPLLQEKYDEAYEVFKVYPDKLKETTKKRFGCPGCLDQDVLLFLYFDGADLKELFLDTDIESLQDNLQAYAKKVLEITESLSE